MDLCYTVTCIAKGTWCLTDPFKTYSYLLEGDEKALLIDTGNGFGDLLQEVRKLTQKPLSVVNTHGHIDHIGSNYLFGEVYLQPADLPVAKEHSSKEFKQMLYPFAKELGGIDTAIIDEIVNLPVVCSYFPIKDGELFDLGGRILEVIEVPGHTPGSICLMDRKNNLLFSGDMICDLGVLLHLGHSASLDIFVRSMEHIREICPPDIKIYAGHHTQPIGTDFIGEYLECAEKIKAGELQGIPNSSAAGDALLYPYKRIALSLPVK